MIHSEARGCSPVSQRRWEQVCGARWGCCWFCHGAVSQWSAKSWHNAYYLVISGIYVTKSYLRCPTAWTDFFCEYKSRPILTPRRLFLACTWVDVVGDMDPSGELMFLQRDETRSSISIWIFFLYALQILKLTGVVSNKRENNLPILIRALLLHLNSLVQLAVRGAKVVVPLHVWFVRNSPLSEPCCVCGWRASAQLCPERLRLKRSAFPRCHFNCSSGRRGRGLGPKQPITERRRVWVTAQLALSAS